MIPALCCVAWQILAAAEWLTRLAACVLVVRRMLRREE